MLAMKPVLVLQHVPYEGGGSIADHLREHAIAFDVVKLWQPYVLPDLARYDALNLRDGKPAKEVGYSTVQLTSEGTASPLFKGFDANIRVLQWHGDAFDVPVGASLLATSPVCHHQAFVCGNAHGVLFHFELTPEMVEGIVEAHREWAHAHFDFDEAQLIKDARQLAPLMKAQCFRLLDNFFGDRSC
jgi:hypothetical protein